ncbi:MAG: hypothetical protein ABI411_17370 [Tahibacter sp.]
MRIWLARTSGIAFLLGASLVQAALLTPQWSKTLAGLINENCRSSTVDREAPPNGPRSLPSCVREQSTAIRDLKVSSHSGALANLVTQAIAFSPDAVRRWQIALCDFCAIVEAPDTISADHLLPDGSAWLVIRSHPLAGVPNLRQRVVRVDPNGNMVADTALTDFPSGRRDATAVFASPAQAIVLQANGSAMRWNRVGAAGTLLESREFSVSAQRDSVWFAAQRELPDGGVVVAVAYRDTDGCEISPPICPPGNASLLRLAADGALLWQTILPDTDPLIALDADGSALEMFGESSGDAPRLRTVSSNGVVSHAFDRPSGETYSRSLLDGPINGHFLVLGDTGLQLINAAGTRVAASAGFTYFSFHKALAVGSLGFLLPGYGPGGADTALLDPDTLAIRAEFDFDGMRSENYGYTESWQLVDDGSVYGSEQVPFSDTAERTRVGRFAVPGTAAAGRIYLDNFD